MAGMMSNRTDSDIPLQGRLQDISLPKILVYLNRNKETGTLSVSTEVFTKKLYMVNGEIIYASSNYDDDRLGEMLLKAGKINLQQYEHSVEILKKTGKKQGAILVELGYIAPKDLFWGVKYQVREIIYSLFQLENGYYEFVHGEVPEDDIVSLKMSLGELIYEGVKRINNWTRIQREMPPMEATLKLSDNPLTLFQEVKLDENDKKVLTLVNGKKSIKEIVDSSGIPSFDAMKTLYVLYSIGILEHKEKEEEEEVIPITVDELMEEVSAEEKEFIAEVNEFYERLPHLSRTEILGIKPGDDPREIKKAYYRLAKKYHPDKHYSSGNADIKEKLNEIFDTITKTYEEIMLNPDLIVDETKKSSSERPVSPEDRAMEQFRIGLQEYKQGNYWGAADSFNWACRMDPKRGKYWYYLALTLKKIPKKLKQAEEAMREAVRLEPYKAEYYIELGNIYLKAGLRKRAKTQFEKALKIKPNNPEAQEALKSLKDI